MMRSVAKVEKVYLYPKPVDFRKSIDGLAALVELDIKRYSYTIHKPHLPREHVGFMERLRLTNVARQKKISLIIFTHFAGKGLQPDRHTD